MRQTRRSRRDLLGMAAGILLSCPRASVGQTQSISGPIRVIVPFAAGGAPDVVARILSDAMSQLLGCPVIVENRPGAGGTLGTTTVARAAADGTTLLVGTSAFIVNKALNPNLPYDPLNDFTPLSEVANAPNAFVVSSSLGLATLQEFLDFAKSQRDGVTYASPGIGTTPQLSVELLRARSGAKFVHVPYNNAPQIVQALQSGTVQFSCAAVPLVQPYVIDGSLKALALTSEARWRGMPNVPVMSEVGFDNFILDTMVMLAAPAHLPVALRDVLSNAAQAALHQPKTRHLLENAGFDVVGNPAAGLAARMRRDVALWADVVRITNSSAN